MAEIQITEEGIYWNKVGVFKVQRSRESGRLYAKQLMGKTETGKGRWEYAAGAIFKLQPQTKVSLELAKAYGVQTGTCMVCGATLTNPESIETGIGPICAGRF